MHIVGPRLPLRHRPAAFALISRTQSAAGHSSSEPIAGDAATSGSSCERPPSPGRASRRSRSTRPWTCSSSPLASCTEGLPYGEQVVIRWISLAPSKIVKIVDYGVVSLVQRPPEIVVSARIQHRLWRGHAPLDREPFRYVPLAEPQGPAYPAPAAPSSADGTALPQPSSQPRNAGHERSGNWLHDLSAASGSHRPTRARQAPLCPQRGAMPALEILSG